MPRTMRTPQQKTEVLHIRVTSEIKRRVTDAAAIDRRTQSGWCVEAIIEKLTKGTR